MANEQSSIHLLLSTQETENKLKKLEETTVIRRKGNSVMRYDENNLAAEGIGEDRSAFDIISKTTLPDLLDTPGGVSEWDIWAKIKGKNTLVQGKSPHDGKKDLVLVSVFHGHGSSPAVSDLLKKTFHACLAWSIARSEAINQGVTIPDAPSSGTHGEMLAHFYGGCRQVGLPTAKINLMTDAIRKTNTANPTHNMTSLPTITSEDGTALQPIEILSDSDSTGDKIGIREDTLLLAIRPEEELVYFNADTPDNILKHPPPSSTTILPSRDLLISALQDHFAT
ncbi:MAG: hypothetical protein L6R35_006748 [Caloplaca aegaea]|nr:MAG: hypothetical protein L6R35_006748 [Caloplaca aegaea]